MQIYNFYNLLTGVISTVLTLLYLAVLIKVRKGSRFIFVIVISALMLASNLTAIVVVYANFKVIGAYDISKNTYPASVYAWIIVQGLMSIVRDATFNVAHWEFAFKYFKISYEVPLMLKGELRLNDPFFFS